jgi:hypothetical protein
MKYRAELRDPNATRATKPEQAFSNSPSELEEWAIQTLKTKAHIPGIEVVIYRTIESPFRILQPTEALAEMERRRLADKATHPPDEIEQQGRLSIARALTHEDLERLKVGRADQA